MRPPSFHARQDYNNENSTPVQPTCTCWPVMLYSVTVIGVGEIQPQFSNPCVWHTCQSNIVPDPNSAERFRLYNYLDAALNQLMLHEDWDCPMLRVSGAKICLCCSRGVSPFLIQSQVHIIYFLLSLWFIVLAHNVVKKYSYKQSLACKTIGEYRPSLATGVHNVNIS